MHSLPHPTHPIPTTRPDLSGSDRSDGLLFLLTPFLASDPCASGGDEPQTPRVWEMSKTFTDSLTKSCNIYISQLGLFLWHLWLQLLGQKQNQNEANLPSSMSLRTLHSNPISLFVCSSETEPCINATGEGNQKRLTSWHVAGVRKSLESSVQRCKEWLSKNKNRRSDHGPNAAVKNGCTAGRSINHGTTTGK